MAGLDLTAFDAVLKDIYLGPIRKQLNTETVLMNRIQKSTDSIDASGRRAIIPILLDTSQAIGARADNDTLPGAQKSSYKDTIVSIKHNYGRIYVTGPTIRASKNSAGAFTRAVDSEITNMVMGLKKDINRQLFGDGTGKLAQVNGDVAAAKVITVDNPGVKFLKVGMIIDIYLAAAIEADSAVIAAVDEANSQITTVSNVTITDNAYIYREDSKDKEMMGLKGIVDDGTNLLTLQSILRTDYPAWKASVIANGGTLRDNSLKLMQQAFTYCEKNGGPTLIVGLYEQRDFYANILVAMKRLVNTMKLDGGFEAIEFNGKPFVPDDDANKSQIEFLNEAWLGLHQQSDFDWMDEDGHILTKISGKDAYEAVLYMDAEFGASRCNVAASLRDLNE